LLFRRRKIIYQFGGEGFNEWTSIYVYLTDILLLSVFYYLFGEKESKDFLKEPLKIDSS